LRYVHELRCLYAEKSVSIFYPDVAYTFADAYREYDYLIVAELDGMCSLLALEDVSRDDEWTKRILDLRAATPPVIWVSSKNIRLNKAMPGVISLIPSVELLNDAEYKWRRIANGSKIARWMASEPFNLIFWSALNLAPYYAELILDDVQRSIGDKCDSTMAEYAFKHLYTLAEILREVIVDAVCTPMDEGDVSYELETLDRLLDRILIKGSLILAYPQIVQYDGDAPMRVKAQKQFLLNILERYHEKLSGLILMSNRGLEKQCDYICRELRNNSEYKCAIGAIDLTRDGSLGELEVYMGRTGSILNLVHQDYSKDLLLRALEWVAKFGGNIYLMVVPETRLRVREASENQRIQQAEPLWNKNIEDIKTCEVALLEPRELLLVLEHLRRSSR